MTQTQRTLNPARTAPAILLLIALIFTGTALAKDKKAKSAAKSKATAAKAQKNSRNDKKARETAKNSRGRERNAKNSRADKRRESKASAKEARVDKRRDRRGSARELKAAKKEQERDRRGGRLSKREQRAEARRLAEQRRREIAEARRRAEIARQAAIARQRALEQAMRDEAMANIAKDDTTGEDLEVRRAAVAALGNHAGTVVVMDPKTGRVYTVVNQDWALRRGFKPCSTIKLMTGMAGLTEKVIDPVQTVSVADRRHAIDLTDALAYSNNGYFQNIGGQVGFDRIISYSRELGLGERTGINHANESPGRVPLFKTGFAARRMCSHGDDFEVTPIQLANMVSAIGNGGNLLVPHLPRTPQEEAQFKTIVRRKINIPQDSIQRLIPGMIGAVNYGSGKRAYDAGQTIAGKTGTCIGQGSWLGLFTSYAPVHNPRLAVVVVTRGPDARRHFPAYVAGQIYRSLKHRFGPGTDGMPYASTPMIPRPKLSASEAAALSDEDREEEAGELGEDSLTGAAAAGAASAPAGGNGVKSVILTAPQTKQTNSSAQPTNQTVAPQPDKQRPRRVHATQP
ncbi:MAG TPA: penicillin-binding transpeptidase domain-containing protein [Pyrinomonadaceae bacterium]|nr:penicillin-binding transpeptidase domain-containing protein [Pyrinomonadaceae bacterium]